MIKFIEEKADNIVVEYNNAKIEIPKCFKAHIINDSSYHSLQGENLNVKFNSEGNDKIWFLARGLYIPLDDIDLSSFHNPLLIPPTLEELQDCLIEFDGRITKVEYKDAFYGESICHEDDEFDVMDGISIAFNRAKKAYLKKLEEEEAKAIKVGDIVRVIDAGQNCSGAFDTVARLIENKELIAKFAFQDYLKESPDKEHDFIVHYIGSDYAYIECTVGGRCRLIYKEAIAKKGFENAEVEDDDWEEEDRW